MPACCCSSTARISRWPGTVEVLNHALRNVPAQSLRMHICWGNYEGPHDHDIPLEKIIGIVLKANPAAILFEASDPRHAHVWIVWKNARIPEDKVLVPGVVTSTSNYVEHPELVARRLLQFAGIGKMDAEISWKKLGALIEGAALASLRLWGR